MFINLYGSKHSSEYNPDFITEQGLNYLANFESIKHLLDVVVNKDWLKSIITKKNRTCFLSCRTKDTFNNNKLNRYKDDKIYYIDDDTQKTPNDFIYITNTSEIESIFSGVFFESTHN
jgi:hypothetical protein